MRVLQAQVERVGYREIETIKQKEFENALPTGSFLRSNSFANSNSP